ncbi:MAG: urease accessory protein [Gammaproteobacteria bacterium]|nr:MAG: urease accessory protein [Gammaproteobacteria bacterium]TND02111.1 MAG: urease accessory protein [Gammaproteobacteria bacterium]
MLQPSAMSHSAAAPDAPGWMAGLTLGFVRRGGRTVLARRSHYGPLHVQRPFYPEADRDGTCHVYLLHPPGGLVGGDRLHVHVDAGAGAEVLLTSPAAQKFYRTNGLPAQLHQHLQVAEGASLEWFPLETIVFNGASGASHTVVELAAGAQFTGWEITCLGRRAAGEGFHTGEYRQRFEILRHDEALWIERALLTGNSAVLDTRWGMAGYSVTGTLVHVGTEHDGLDVIREATSSDRDNELFSVTKMDDVVVCRYLGHHAERARSLFVRAWEVLRQQASGRPVCAPRIWNT